MGPNSTSSKKHLSLPLIRFYMASVVTALSHLHKHCIVYRNLKPEHVMIDDKGHIKLIDFSCAKKLPYRDDHGRLQNKAFTICGVAEYLAPEVILLGDLPHYTPLSPPYYNLYESFIMTQHLTHSPIICPLLPYLVITRRWSQSIR